MKLAELINNLNITVIDSNVVITGLSVDSRTVKQGHLFVAYAGHDADGRDYIADAVANGAVAVLTTADVVVEGADYLSHPNPHECVAPLAAVFYAAKPAHILAITGTNGKTSVASFCRQLLATLGHKSASIGTLGVELQDGNSITPFGDNAQLTSPDPITLHRTLAELAADGVTHACIEASSHGLDQGRLDNIDIQVAAFTNLSRDHLDYHGSMEVYFEAKKRLFHELLAASHAQKPTAILPTNSHYLGQLRDGLGCYTLTYGSGGNVQLANVRATADGLHFDLGYQQQSVSIASPLLGVFQAHNIACAVAILLGCGCDFRALALAVESLTEVAGRMERVAHSNVLVDYAHTPDALENALASLREHLPDGKLHVVFGCGGERDTGKRGEMGNVAERLADRIIITDDNPRNEDPTAIRAMILAHCNATEIANRAEAIKTAINELGANDILLIAGKGHEDYQIIGEERIAFSDKEVAREVLSS